MANELAPSVLTMLYFQAMLRRDVPALGALLSNDFILIEPLMGWKVTRSTLLQDLASGALSFDIIEATGTQVREYETATLITGRTELKGRLAHSEFAMACRYSHLYIRENASWLLVYAQETPIDRGSATVET